jgi:filamentous hemagglutinin family protein
VTVTQPELSEIKDGFCVAGRTKVGMLKRLLNVDVVGLGILLCAVGFIVPHSEAQVPTTTITSSGLGTALNGSTTTPCLGVTCNITGGDRRGQNLFHSFGRFDIGAGNTANFLNDSGLATSNIIGRVTGGQTSNIFGTIQTTNFGAANLFLMNPFGILFGSTARLNVGGSFHATTADYIKLGSDGIFYADPAKASALTSAPPSAFGFLTNNPAAIDINTTSLPPRLVGLPGKTLSFVGGPVNVGAADGSSPGFVLARAGRVNLISVASPGEATFDGTGFNIDGFAQQGNINIRGGSLVDGKEVFIRGGRLEIRDAVIFPGAFSLFGVSESPNDGEVNIKLTNDLVIVGNRLVPLIQDRPGIQTFAGSPSTVLAGNVPDIRVEANAVALSGLGVIQATRLGPGVPPDLTVQAGSVRVENGALIGILNRFEGPGGSITVNADDVTLSGDASFGFTGIAAQGTFHPRYPRTVDVRFTNADGGTITVNARTLNVHGSNTGVTTDSRNLGRSGDITVQAGDVFLSDGGTIAAQSLFAGNSGNIIVNATGRIIMNDGQIRALTGGSGDGGTINVTAGQSITMSGTGSLLSTTTRVPPIDELDRFARVFSPLAQVCPAPCNYASLVNQARKILNIADPTLFDVLRMLRDNFRLIAIDDLTVGNAGKLSITAPQLTLNSGSLVSSSTGWDGNAGEILGNVGSLTVQSGAEIRSRSGFPDPDTGQLLLGTGNAGSITFTASDTISVSGHSPTSGAGSAITTSTLGNGNGGDIVLNSAGTVQIANGGTVTADSLGGTGLAGNITINAGNQIVVTDGSVSTRAVTSDGGNITMTTTGSLVHLTDSQITTSVESGVGTGGNITVNSDLVVLDDSQILANAFGGPGGNINITADVFLVNSGGTSPTSLAGIVDASSALSTPGTIDIQATFTDVTGEVAQLPETPLRATELLRAACAARFAGGTTSSLVLGGRDGVPLQPGGLMPSPLYLANEADAPAAGTKISGQDLPWRFSLLGSRDPRLTRYSLLPNAKCAF